SHGGNDTFTGGTGNDFFAFAAAELTTSDTIDGGPVGYDALYISTPGTVSASAFNHVTGIEALVIGPGAHAITLSEGLVAVGSFAVVDGTGDNVVDAAGVGATTTIAFYGAGGADTLKGGSGNDYFVMPDAQFAELGGGAGLDRIILTSNFDGKTFDLSANASK